jgi:hypothetical protein
LATDFNEIKNVLAAAFNEIIALRWCLSVRLSIDGISGNKPELCSAFYAMNAQIERYARHQKAGTPLQATIQKGLFVLRVSR